MMAAATINNAHLPTLAQPDSDPRIWLEDVTGEEALAWVKARNAAALSSFGAIALALASRHFCHAASRHCSTATYATSAAGNPSDSATYSRILEILDSKAKIPYIGRVLNGLYYNFWQDETHVRGIWRRCTLDEYRKESLPPPAVCARLGEPLHRVELRTGGARLGDGARPGCPRCGGGRLVGVGRLHPARRGAHRPQGAGDDSPLAGRLRRHRGARDVCSRYREGARR